jgi:hypothetical protein
VLDTSPAVNLKETRNMHVRSIRLSVALIVLGILAAPAGAGPLYTFTPIAAPTGFSSFSVNSIDNAGEFVGLAVDPTTGFAASYLYSGGVYTQINVPGAIPGTTSALISLSGQLFGSFSDASGQTHGFIQTTTGFQQIDIPGAQSTFVAGLNSQGQAVGGGDTGYNVYQNGNFTPLPPSPPQFTASGINDSGDIVGSAIPLLFPTSTIFQGELLHNGQYMPLNDPNASTDPGAGPLGGTLANGINNSGTIVGSYIDDQIISHGFVYQDGVYTTVDYPTLVPFLSLNAVNDSGEIVGSYFDSSSLDTFSFLATPAPEPESLTLVAAAGLTLAGRRWRKRGT